MTDGWYPTFGGERVSDPASIAQQLVGRPLTDDLPLFQLANSYSCPIGSDPGVGYVLMQRSRLEKLAADGLHDLVFRDQWGGVTLKSMTMTRAISLFGKAGDEKCPMLVQFMDRRVRMQRTSLNVGYNVRKFQPDSVASLTDEYHTETLSGGTALYDWDGMIADIWSEIPATAGPTPTVPTAPTEAPNNMRFFGIDGWEALHTGLKTVGMTTAYDPISDQFSIIIPGQTQTGLAAALTALSQRKRRDIDPRANFHAGNAPANIDVHFEKRDDTERNPSGVSFGDPVHTINVATGITGGVGTWALYGDIHAEVNASGVVQNTTQLTNRANFIAQQVLQNNLHKPQGWVFGGAVSSLVTGSELTRLIWRDYSDGDGLITEADNDHHFPMRPAEPPEERIGGGGGRLRMGELTANLNPTPDGPGSPVIKGTVRIWEQVGDNYPEEISPAVEVTVINTTEIQLTTGVLLAVEEPENWNWPQVFPREIEECLRPQFNPQFSGES